MCAVSMVTPGPIVEDTGTDFRYLPFAADGFALTTLSTSASRLDKTLSSERSFTGDATHQMRTGLTGIALQLQLLASHDDEAVRTDANHALARCTGVPDPGVA